VLEHRTQFLCALSCHSPHSLSYLRTIHSSLCREHLIHHLDSPPSSLLRLQEHYHSFRPEQLYEHRAKRVNTSNPELDEWRETAKAIWVGDGEGNGEREVRFLLARSICCTAHILVMQTIRTRVSAETYVPQPTTYSTDPVRPFLSLFSFFRSSLFLRADYPFLSYSYRAPPPPSPMSRLSPRLAAPSTLSFYQVKPRAFSPPFQDRRALCHRS
jgi:hypothetical protein